MTSISHLYRILNSVPERTLEATMEELKKYDFVYDNTEQEKKILLYLYSFENIISRLDYYQEIVSDNTTSIEEKLNILNRSNLYNTFLYDSDFLQNPPNDIPAKYILTDTSNYLLSFLNNAIKKITYYEEYRDNMDYQRARPYFQKNI